jgi:transcription initiation factor TFIIIB Brf1 subunit/transcription initiation factor TFIIB
MYANLDKTCTHNAIYDTHTGDEICDKCGKVLSGGISFEESAYSVNFKSETACIDITTLDVILTACDTHHVAKDIKRDVIKLCSEIHRKAYARSTPEEIVGYALYKAFDAHGVARTIEEISCMLHCRQKNIYDTCKAMDNISIVAVKCSSIAPRIACLLNINNYKIGKNLANVADCIQETRGNMHPNVILALVYACHFATTISLREIAHACDTKVATIKRVQRRLGRLVNAELSTQVWLEYF